MISKRSRASLGAGPVAVLLFLAAAGMPTAFAQTPDGAAPGTSDRLAPPAAPADPVQLPAEAPQATVPAPPAAPPAIAQTAPAETTPPPAAAPADPAPLQPAQGAAPVEIDPAESASAMAQTMGHDLSPWGMFMAADWVVKGVMILLAVFSLVTWMIWIAKGLELGFAKRRARSAVGRLERAGSLDAAIDDGRRPMKRGPVAALALTAAAESELSGSLPAEGVKERVAVALQRIEARSGRRISRGTGILATIGSTSPFIGLFGTVWGIMNSFIGIAETNTTNLAVVAPGIAEALLATGVGLVAAIPAVIIYNAFARSIAGYRAILSDGSASVLRHLSRDLDRRDAGYGRAHAQPAE